MSFVLIFALGSLSSSLLNPFYGLGFGREERDKMNVHKIDHDCLKCVHESLQMCALAVCIHYLYLSASNLLHPIFSF